VWSHTPSSVTLMAAMVFLMRGWLFVIQLAVTHLCAKEPVLFFDFVDEIEF
jgi:hypothetical protein